MCGIVGILSANPSRADLQRINDLLIHRGPDDVGVFIGSGAALAVRRLSIIDLETGHQPLSNEDGRIWIAYNGEVYNAPALRVKLEAAGHRFQSRADTEVVIHAYEEWGENAVTRLRGMFAFALWDGERRRLLLARDRFGIKPLYYAQADGHFACASEIRPILAALPQLSREANPEAMWRLFELGFIPSPLTAFQGIYKVPAAHTLTVENGSITLRRYWQLNFPRVERHRPIDEETAAEKFLSRLRETVGAWRMSDVPVGSLLSGGIDSASLATLLSEVSGELIHTFNIGFKASSHDETHGARTTAQMLGSRHHECTFSGANFDLLPEVVRRLEEPQCSATSVAIYLLYKMCGEAGLKVVMTGEGADELLAGYPWFDGDRRVRRLLRLPGPARTLLARIPLPASAGARRVVAQGTSDPVQRYALWHRVTHPEGRSALLTTRYTPISAEWRRCYIDKLHDRHPLDQFLFLESQTRLIDFINFEVDRMSMAHSVEARPPFLDHKLWEFCARLPPECKLNSQGDKRLLRLAMKDRLPEPVRQRAKQGLATPHARWWRADELPAWAEEALHPSALTQTGYFDIHEVARLRELHRTGRADASQTLMGILTTQLWHDAVLTH